MQQPLLSIVTITYNHEPYIAKTIESVLMQQVTFPIEYIIAEDCSTDNTRKICQTYVEKHPDIIRLITSGSNVGAIENERRAFAAAKGKFIACCEGDDYWTDPLKLQKQVDFLEAHPNYSACFHRYHKCFLDDNKYVPDDMDNLFVDIEAEGIDITKDIYMRRWTTQYFTMVFRRDMFDTSMMNCYKYFRDTIMVYYLFLAGKCYVFNFFGGVYNITHEGYYTNLSFFDQNKTEINVFHELWQHNRNCDTKKMYVGMMQNAIDQLFPIREHKPYILLCALKIFILTGKFKKFIKNIIHITIK